jgi:hypothetical protein
MTDTTTTKTAEALAALLDEVRQCFTRDDDLPGNLLHRIDEALAAQPQAEPVALLWQVMNALHLASAICDAVPSRDPGRLGKLVNAQDDGTHGYRVIHDAEKALAAYLTTPTTAPAQAEPVAAADLLKEYRDACLQWHPAPHQLATRERYTKAYDALVAALAARPPVAQQGAAEAVAEVRDGAIYSAKYNIKLAVFTRGASLPAGPLYAAPVAAAQPVAQGLTDDERAAVEFYILNPSAAVIDVVRRFKSHPAEGDTKSSADEGGV